MKVGIRQKVLLDVLSKGAMAAISKEAQEDTSALSIIIKSIKITANDNFTIESNDDLIATKYSVVAKEEFGVIVKEPGSIVIPAKEFINWVKNQGDDDSITMTLQKLPTPEIINTLDDNDSSSKFSIKKIGTIRLSAKGTSKTQTKWEMDCFDADDKQSINYNEKTNKHFEISSQQFIDAIHTVKFAAIDKDPDHVLDGISMQVHNDELYFATTDMHNCAIYKIGGEKNIYANDPLIVSASLLDSICKIISKDDKIVLSYSPQKEKVYITQRDINIRLACTEKKNISKFISVNIIMNKQYDSLAECSKSLILSILSNASVVNKRSALFTFSKDNKTLTVKALSEDSKLKPNVRQCECDATLDSSIILSVKGLMSGIRVISDNDIKISVPANFKSVKIVPKEGDNFLYYSMAVVNPIYSQVFTASP